MSGDEDDEDDVHEAQTKVGEVSSEILRIVSAVEDLPPSSGRSRPTPPVAFVPHLAKALATEKAAVAEEESTELSDDDVLPASQPLPRLAVAGREIAQAEAPAPVPAPAPPRADAAAPPPSPPPASEGAAPQAAAPPAVIGPPVVGLVSSVSKRRWYGDLRLRPLLLATLPALALLAAWWIYQAMLPR